MNNLQGFEKFIISQKAVIIQNDKLLLLAFTNHPGFWDIPGGRIEVGEDPRESFKRELQEELNVDSIQIAGVADADVWYHGENKIPFCGIVYRVEANLDNFKISDEHLEYKWISKSEIDDYKYLWPKLGRMLKKAFEK